MILPDVRRFLLDVSSEMMGGGFILLLRWWPPGPDADWTVIIINAKTVNTDNIAE